MAASRDRGEDEPTENDGGSEFRFPIDPRAKELAAAISASVTRKFSMLSRREVFRNGPGERALAGVDVPRLIGRTDHFEKLRLGISAWWRAYDWSAFTAATGVLRTAISVARPWNLHDIDLNHMEDVAAVALDDGIPVAWVPRAVLVQKLVSAPRGRDCFVLLADHADEVLDDCVGILDERGVHTRFAELSREAIACYRDGRVAAAQALAASIVESIVSDAFDCSGGRLAGEPITPWMETTLGDLPLNLALRPLDKAFTRWFVEDGDPVPEEFSRHVTAHAAGERGAFTDATSLVAVMLATSLSVELAPNPVDDDGGV